MIYIYLIDVSIYGVSIDASMAISMAYVREYPHKIWPYIVQYLHFRNLQFPLKNGRLQLGTSAIKGGLSIVMFDYQRVPPRFFGW